MFYKQDESDILSGRIISASTITLIEEMKDTYTYPVDGWYWFDSDAQANFYFGIITEEEPVL